MSIYTKEDIIRITKEEKVNFINLQFTDILGTLKSVSVTTSQLEKALNNRCMFDGSSIDGFVRIEESDMCLYPDLDSFVILPWDECSGKTARLICDVYNSDGTPFEGDPRYVLRRAIKRAADMGYTCNIFPGIRRTGNLPPCRTHRAGSQRACGSCLLPGQRRALRSHCQGGRHLFRYHRYR